MTTSAFSIMSRLSGLVLFVTFAACIIAHRAEAVATGEGKVILEDIYHAKKHHSGECLTFEPEEVTGYHQGPCKLFGHLRDAGFVHLAHDAELTAAVLAELRPDVLVLNRFHSSRHPTNRQAFLDMLRDWVFAGGSLWIYVEHDDKSASTSWFRPLLRDFGVDADLGTACEMREKRALDHRYSSFEVRTFNRASPLSDGVARISYLAGSHFWVLPEADDGAGNADDLGPQWLAKSSSLARDKGVDDNIGCGTRVPGTQAAPARKFPEGTTQQQLTLFMARTYGAGRVFLAGDHNCVSDMMVYYGDSLRLAFNAVSWLARLARWVTPADAFAAREAATGLRPLHLLFTEHLNFHGEHPLTVNGWRQWRQGHLSHPVKRRRAAMGGYNTFYYTLAKLAEVRAEAALRRLHRHLDAATLSAHPWAGDALFLLAPTVWPSSRERTFIDEHVLGGGRTLVLTLDERSDKPLRESAAMARVLERYLPSHVGVRRAAGDLGASATCRLRLNPAGQGNGDGDKAMSYKFVRRRQLFLDFYNRGGDGGDGDADGAGAGAGDGDGDGGEQGSGQGDAAGVGGLRLAWLECDGGESHDVIRSFEVRGGHFVVASQSFILRNAVLGYHNDGLLQSKKKRAALRTIEMLMEFLRLNR